MMSFKGIPFGHSQLLRSGAAALLSVEQCHVSERHSGGAGRALVELVIEKGDNSYAFVTDAGGGPQQQARLEMVLDGYSAPLTAGNFAVNVLARSHRR